MKRTDRRGQTWGIDLGISLALFTVAVIVAYQLLENTIDENDFDEVKRQATAAADLLMNTGYPTAWTNDTIIRAGVISDGVLSARKMNALATLTNGQLRGALRATDRIALAFRNESGDLIALSDTCVLGDQGVTETAHNHTLAALALARTPYPIADGANITIVQDDSGYAMIDDADILLIEGDLTEDSLLTATQIARTLDDAARRGITVIIIGSPHAAAFGVAINASNASTISITDSALLAEFPEASLNISGGADVEIPTINLPTGANIADVRNLAVTDDGATAFATWIYGDARIYYFATSDGTFPSSASLEDALLDFVGSRITVERPLCDNLQIPSDATQIVRIDRVVAYHDQMLTLQVYAWRMQ